MSRRQGEVFWQQRSSGKARRKKQSRRMLLDVLEKRELLVATPAYFDFGVATSSVEPGYEQVTHTSLYSSSQGFGWASTTGLYSATNNNDPEHLRKDVVYGGNASTFLVDISNGIYDVTITTGFSWNQNNVRIKLEGTVVDNVNTAAHQHYTNTYRVTVSDGQLSLDIEDLDTSNKRWLINALAIEEATDPTPPAPLTALALDFGTESSQVVSGYSRATKNTIYTAMQQYGWDQYTVESHTTNSQGPDDLRRDMVHGSVPGRFLVDLANGTYDVTITSGYSWAQNNIEFKLEGVVVETLTTAANQYFTNTYRVTVSDGQLTLEIADLDTSNRAWYLNSLVIVEADDVPPPAPLTALSIDFGTDTSPVVSGYARATRTTLYSQAGQYGWDRYTVESHTTNSQGPDDLRRDMVHGSVPGRFLVDLANGTYDVTITSGYSWAQNNIEFKLEGVVVETLTTAANQYFTNTYRVTVSDGQLTLEIADLDASNKAWYLNSLVIVPADDSPPPAPLTSLSVDFGTSASGIASGFVQGTRTTLYTPLQQYGWDRYTVEGEATASTAVDALKRDQVRGNVSATFLVDLANGAYDVTLVSGFNAAAQTNVQFKLQGATVATFSTSSGQYFEQTFRVEVTANRLVLDVQDLDASSKLWMLNGIVIVPAPNTAPVGNDDTYGVSADEELSVIAPGVLANDTDADGHTLSVDSWDAASAYGVAIVGNANGSFTYDPRAVAAFIALAAGQTLQDTFSYTVKDNFGGSDTATVTITVTGVNDAPTAVDDEYQIDEDTLLTIGASLGLLANDTDLDAGQTLSVSAFDAASVLGAAVSVNADGSFTYDPRSVAELQALAPGQSLQDTFGYTVSDGAGGFDTATVTITVTGLNDAPVAGDDTAQVDEDDTVLIDVLANDSDPEGDPLSIHSVGTPDYGAAAIEDGKVRYTPPLDFHGVATFTYTATDGNGGFDTAMVTVTVVSINDPPTHTVPGAQQASFEQPLVFSAANGNLISVDDVDLGAGAIEIALTATNGTLSLYVITGLTFSVGDGTADAAMTFTGSLADVNAALSQLVFTPATGHYGSASIEIVSDDLGGSGAGGPLTAFSLIPITVLPPPPLTTLQVDFGTSGSPVASGHSGATHTTLYSVPQQYGWTAAVQTSNDVGSSHNDWRRDNVQGSAAGVFVVDLENGVYDVTITSGHSAAQDNVQLSLEGTVVETFATLANQYFTSTYRITVSDGQLTLEVSDLDSSNKRWHLNALTIVPAADPPAPAPLTSLALDFGTDSSAVMPNFVRALRTTLYSAEQQYGWDRYTVPTATSGAEGYGSLRRDWVQSSGSSVFYVDLANGQYDVTIVSGSTTLAQNNVNLRLQGATAAVVNTAAGAFFEDTFRVAVTDGRLALEVFDADGADQRWFLNALSVRPAPSSPPPVEAKIGPEGSQVDLSKHFPLPPPGETYTYSVKTNTDPTTVSVEVDGPTLQLQAFQFGVVSLFIEAITTTGTILETALTVKSVHVENGSFEADRITHQAGWDIFPTIAGWSIVAGSGYFELQSIGSAAHGDQFLELAGDLNGHFPPDPPGEDGRIAISQTIYTEPGNEYILSFAFKHRSGTQNDANKMLVRVLDGQTEIVTQTITNESESSPTDWKYYTIKFKAVSSETTLYFEGKGEHGVLGTHLDDVQVKSAEQGNTTNQDCGCRCFLGACQIIAAMDTAAVQFTQYIAGVFQILYNSLVNPHPLLSIDHTLSSSSALPDRVEAWIDFGGIVSDPVFYDVSSFTPGESIRISLLADAAGLTSGRHAYTIYVKEHYGATAVTREVQDAYELVSRTDSALGNRWSIDGLDTLQATDNGVVIVQGNNSGLFYRDQAGQYESPAGNFDRLTYDNGQYIRTDRWGGQQIYSSSGMLIAQRDANGNETTYTYIDANNDGVANELESITDPFGRVTLLAYSGGVLSTVTDFAGRVTTFTYSGNRLVSIAKPDPDGAGPLTSPVTSFEYDTAGLLTKVTDPNGNETTINYNPTSHKFESQVYPDQGLLRVTPVRGAGWVDPASNQGTEQNPAAATRSTDAWGVHRDEYDRPSFYQTDRYGQVTAHIDRLGNLYQWVRDQNGRVIQQTLPDPDGPGGVGQLVVRYKYDARGNMVKETTYESNGVKLTQLASRSWTYDSTFSRVTSYTDELGRLTQYEIDPANGNLLSVRQVVGAVDSIQNGETDDLVTTFTYTVGINGIPAGLLASVTDPLGRIEKFVYYASPGKVGRLYYQVTAFGAADAATVFFDYDLAGNVTHYWDELGRLNQFAYDNLDRLTEIVSPDPDGAGPLLSPVTTFAYDANDNLRFVTDPLGNTTEYRYDSRDRLARVILPDPDGAGPLSSPETIYAYDLVGNLTSITDPLGRVTTYSYDALNRPTGVTLPDPDGAGPLAAPEMIYAYDAVGNLRSVTDALGNVTTYAYDSRHRLLAITEPDPDGAGSLPSPVTTFSYDVAGQLLSVTDPLGRVTSFDYDDLGRLTSVTLPDPDGAGPLTAPVTTFEYDKVGNRTAVVDPLGNRTAFAYDDRNRLKTVTQADPDGAVPLASPVTSYVYDAASQLLSITDPLGRVVGYAYDNLGRLLTVTQPDPDGAGPQSAPVTTYAYDAVGNLLSVTDPLSHVTSYEYDNLYRVLRHIDANLAETDFTYDAVGNLLSLTDPVGNTTSWVYDGLNRVTTEANELNHTRSFSYDAVGNLLEKTDRLGRVTTFEYDGLHRRTHERWLDSLSQVVREFTYVYDAASQLTSAGDADSTYAYASDGLGRVVTETQTLSPLDFTVVFASAYDAAGNRTSLAATLGSAADYRNDYVYDHLHRLTQLTQQGLSGGNAVAEKRVDLAYNAAGQFDSLARYADVAGLTHVATSTYGYDGIGRLTSLLHEQGSTLLAGYELEWDPASRITAIANLVHAAESAIYSHDDRGQLTGADRTGTANDEDYSYDDNGNRTMTGYVVGANNQLLSDGVYTYEYDAEGNRTAKEHIASGERVEYAWDHRNRLVRVTFLDDQQNVVKVVEQTYDVFNRWIGKQVDEDGDQEFDRSEAFVYHQGQIVLRLADAGAGPLDEGSLTNRYLWGPAVDHLLVDEVVSSLAAEGDRSWALGDHLGTIRDWANDAGAIENHLIYDSYGNVLAETNSSAVDPLFGFTGRPYDADSELQNNWHRWYDAAVGRWVSEDPIGFAAFDLNLVRYVNNAANIHIDPTGLEPPDRSTLDYFNRIGGDAQEIIGPPYVGARFAGLTTLERHIVLGRGCVGLTEYRLGLVPKDSSLPHSGMGWPQQAPGAVAFTDFLDAIAWERVQNRENEARLRLQNRKYVIIAVQTQAPQFQMPAMPNSVSGLPSEVSAEVINTNARDRNWATFHGDRFNTYCWEWMTKGNYEGELKRGTSLPGPYAHTYYVVLTAPISTYRISDRKSIWNGQ